MLKTIQIKFLIHTYIKKLGMSNKLNFFHKLKATYAHQLQRKLKKIISIIFEGAG